MDRKTIHINPLTRIEGHAGIRILLDDQGSVAQTITHFSSIRGFEEFIKGRPAEEVIRIVTRICGICPWHHHIAAAKAVDQCFGADVPPAGNLLRECMQNMAHISDKILHFYFLAAPDFFMGPDAGHTTRNIMGIAAAEPGIAKKVVQMRQKSQMMMEAFAGKVIHPVAAVPGGFSKPLSESRRKALLDDTGELLEFAVFTISHARKKLFPLIEKEMKTLGDIQTGFIGTVDEEGCLNFYNGNIRLMAPDGSLTEFSPENYQDHIKEKVLPHSFGKFPYADAWKEGFSMDLANPKGIYRANSLARLNTCDSIATPIAGEELENFRKTFGRMPQQTMLYHWARLIELVYACERCIELLQHPDITGKSTRSAVTPAAGRGVGHVEAPRGTLIHDYQTDENGKIISANMIVGTTHNLAPISMSADQAARQLIKDFHVDDGILNRIQMAVRAYDP